MENSKFKKGDKVYVELDAVLDATNDKSHENKGVLTSDVDKQKAQGYEDQYNYFYTVLLDDGNEINVNEFELTQR